MIESHPLVEDLKDLEGRLIEAYRLSRDQRPPWNRIGGSATGALQVQGFDFDNIFDIITGVSDSPFVARRTIRGLSADDTAMTYEEHLHTARMWAVMFDPQGTNINWSDFRKLLNSLPPHPLLPGERMQCDGYLDSLSPFSLT